MKKLLFAALALTLAAGVSAFVAKSKPSASPKPLTTSMWFDFIGTTGEEGDLTKYVQDPQHLDPCTGASDRRCEVFAPVIQSGPNAGKPDLSLIQDITYYP